METPAVKPSFREALLFWLKLGFISFGGPTGQIAIMHAELVEKRKWISEARFLHALNFCMLLPGPEATQLATYVGWVLHRTWGGIVAGTLFVLPSAIFLWVLSFVYVKFGKVPEVTAIFYGLKPAVVAIVISALVRIGSRALTNPAKWGIALGAFTGIFFFRVPFPVIVFGALALGFTGGKLWPKIFDDGAQAERKNEGEIDPGLSRSGPTLARSLKILLVCSALWWTPIIAARLVLGGEHTISQEGIFFSKAAVVTFGGAYAVLPYVAQQAVEQYGWLRAGQMLDGLGLAETTPGPLIMVLQFVGFVGGWQHPGNLSPLMAATVGAAMTTWVTFVPCFLWILLGAPYVEQLRHRKSLSSALGAVTAAVVGVILNLAVWFGWQVLWRDGGLDGFAIAVTIVCYLALLRWKNGVIPVVVGSGLVGWIYGVLFV
jgi:chromate transporter